MLLYGNPSPAEAWIDNGDGTATHTVTGLMWMRSALGQVWTGTTCTGIPKTYNNNKMKGIVHHFAGYEDWRVPTINELMSIIDFRSGFMSSGRSIFPNYGKEYYLTCSGFQVDLGYGGVVYTVYPSGSLRMVRSLNTVLSLEEKAKFHDNGNGTATDVTTGLTWMRCALGQTWDGFKGIGDPYLLTREDALSIRHTFAGFDDWRLPSIGELNSIVDRTKKNPCANTDIFASMVMGKYISVPLIRIKNNFCFINFVNGDINFNSLDSSGISRLVRGEYRHSSVESGKSPILISSNNETKGHQLSFHTSGSGSGNVTCTPNQTSHAVGSLVTLSATPETGSQFIGWSGDITESAPTFSFSMDSAKTVIAHFARLSFALDETTTGSGSGSLSRTPAADSYEYGDSVTLKASAATGSIFNGWAGDAEGLETTCTVKIDSAKRVIAEFVKLDIPELDIAVTFDSCESVSMKGGADAFLVYLLIANQGPSKIHVELPLASCVTRRGEEITQDVWLTGFLIGGAGATIRAGSFRKTGLVFHQSKLKEISAGDHLHLTVAQTQPTRRCNFSFRCTDSQSRAFTLVSASEEAVQAAAEESIARSPDMAAMLQRIEMLEAGLSEALRKLDALQAIAPTPAPAPTATTPAETPTRKTSPAQTLPDILAWLATQEQVSLAVLRLHLLPLDLLPSAVIDELNEQALDLVGDVAFEEVGEEIVIAREVLFEVLAKQE
jgi:hypothetical protein